MIKDRIGIRYGRLIVIKFAGTSWRGIALWLCKCDCGKEVIIRSNSLQSGNTKSCGCLQQEMMNKRTGKNHPNYTNGFRCGKYTKEMLEQKEKTRRRNNYICQECGKTQEQNLKEFNRKLDVHHIDGNDTNNMDENMVTLCLNCHRNIERIKNETKSICITKTTKI